MTTKADELAAEALKLDLDARAKLAERLILSLEEPTESEINRLGLAEARRRLSEIEGGKVAAAPADEALQRAASEIS